MAATEPKIDAAISGTTETVHNLKMVYVPVELLHWTSETMAALRERNLYLQGRVEFLEATHRRVEPGYVSLANVAPFSEGGKIPTIKKLRELTGLGLKETKDAVDAWERRGLVQFPTSAPYWQDLPADRERTR